MGTCKWCGDVIVYDARYDNWESVATGDPECGESTHEPESD